MDAGVDGEFRVQHTAPDPELLKKQLETVASVDVSDKDDALALDEFQLEDDVDQQEFFIFSTSGSIPPSVLIFIIIRGPARGGGGGGGYYFTQNWVTPPPSSSSSSSSRRMAGFRQKSVFRVSTSAVSVALMRNVWRPFGSALATAWRSSS